MCLAFSGLYRFHVQTLPGGTGTSIADWRHRQKDKLGTVPDLLDGQEKRRSGMAPSHRPGKIGTLARKPLKLIRCPDVCLF